MATKLISFDRIEKMLGRRDFEEESTNGRGLKIAKAVIHAAIEEELTERQRECVLLYFYNGLTEEQAAHELGITKSTVCRHLQKAKSRLGRAVRYAGIEDFSAVI